MFKVTQLVGDRAGLEPSASILLLLLFLFVTACGLNLKLYFIVVRICNMRSTFLKVYNTVSVMLYSRSLKLIHCN